MPQQETHVAFDEDRAAAYDEQFAKLAPLKNALHLCTLAVLADAAADARVLCVGAGTGAEVCFLAEAFPGWTFTLVEPAAPMLQRARQKAEAMGILDRCTFHEGYLENLPESALFDIATSILVAQFILDPSARRNYFRGIAARLRPGGDLVCADLATENPGDPADGLFAAWLALMRYNGFTEEAVENYRTAIRNGVAILPPGETAAFLPSSGFTTPVCICQTLLIHVWHARRDLDSMV